MDKHDTLLLSSASKANRAHLRSVFADTFNLLEASNTQQTLLLLRQNIDCIAAVLLDITDMETVDVPLIRKAENTALLQSVPVIILCQEDTPDILNQAFSFGASDVIPLVYDAYAMLHRVENIIDLHIHKQYLESMVEAQANLLRHTSDTMVDALSSIIEYRSVESGQHILRIRHFTKILLEEVARCCPEYRLTDQTISIICSASALHDIGKIAIPDAILMKPGKLTPEEWEIMKTHAITGCHILDSLGAMADKEYLRYAHNICHYHHERWDGSGYPEGLGGNDIPICAQVVGLADAYDALTSKRVYKDAFSFPTAVNMILRGECGAFSPSLLECFKHVTHQYEDLARAYADGMSPKNESFDTALPPPEQEADTMDRTRGKYFALVHFINGFLIELDLDRRLFHLIYNPYPELAQFQEMNTLEEIGDMIMTRLIHPDNAAEIERFLSRDISKFIDDGLRRANFRFRLNSRDCPEGDIFEVTLLRINPLAVSRRTLAVLARKLESTAPAAISGPVIPAESTYCCRNDACFTLVDTGSASTLAGYTVEEIREKFGGRMLELAHPEDKAMIREAFSAQLKSNTSVQLEHRVVCRNGSVIWVMNRSRLVVGLDGEEYLYSFLTDITAAHQVNDILTEKLNRYEIILAQTENVLFEWDITTDKISFSNTWERIFGYPAPTENFRQFLLEGSSIHPDDVPLLVDRINRLEGGSAYEMVEVRIAAARGRYLWCRFRATAMREGSGMLRGISGILINIDAEKQAEQLLQSRAEQDSLTRLLNKDAARKQAEEYFARYFGNVNSALLIIDLDNFKQVNDQYGHLFGDTVLTQVAREIRRLFRSQDIIARIGGDEFMVIMRGISDRTLLEQRCQRLLHVFREHFQNRKYNLPLSCSIGIAQSPIHGKTYVELFQHADQALYRAKALGKNQYVFYNSEDSAFLGQAGRTSTVINPIDSDSEPGMANDNIVRYAFQKLYTSQDEEASINEILRLIGQKMNVSRVYVFENSDDNRFCSNTYEWCNDGIHPELENLQNVSYETDIPGYEDNFNEGGIFYCPDVSLLPANVYDILAPQGIKSMLQCAIRENGIFRGYVGFDECVEQRMWTKDQISLLTFFCESLSMFLLRRRRQEKVQRQADELSSILDNQDAWIYIVDPDTHTLKYVNARIKSRFPELRPGQCCHQAIRGLDKPCPGCPAANIRQNKTGRFLDRNLRSGTMLVDGTLIQWDGKDSCLVTCRLIPE